MLSSWETLWLQGIVFTLGVKYQLSWFPWFQVVMCPFGGSLMGTFLFLFSFRVIILHIVQEKHLVFLHFIKFWPWQKIYAKNVLKMIHFLLFRIQILPSFIKTNLSIIQFWNLWSFIKIFLNYLKRINTSFKSFPWF